MPNKIQAVTEANNAVHNHIDRCQKCHGAAMISDLEMACPEGKRLHSEWVNACEGYMGRPV